jgi:hypothetical protein
MNYKIYSVGGMIPAEIAAGIDRRIPPRNFQYTNALDYLCLQSSTYESEPGVNQVVFALY